MKRSLPTVPGNRAGRQHAGRDRHVHWGAERAHAAEREELERPVIAVAHVGQSAAAARLAVQLCAAFVREAVPVGGLITVDSGAAAPEAQAAQAAMLEAGAREAVLVRKPETDARAALAHALDQLPATEWVVALGNALPQLYHPYFTVVVTGARRTLTAVEPLVLLAELEVSAPGDELATLLARRLHVQWDERAAAT